MQDIHAILYSYWGFESFRPLQEDIVKSVLNGEDTLALLPTGGGKSLCYQVPAMARPGICLVISPLIALMKDQVENIRKKGITAYAIYSGMTRKEVINVLKTVRDSNCKFLYVSPERLETSLFREYLPGFDINLIAVDEAHCISQWGYDFRPSYLRIAELKKELPEIPLLALTASATPEVQHDICEKLLFAKPNICRQSFARPDLSYSVIKADSKLYKIADVLKKVNGSAIVYCKSRKRTKEISDMLTLQGIPADFYHAGLTQEERNRKQEQWMTNKLRVIVCTNAFGMGIDKPDVRLVMHADLPDCLENYYQEAGRAGRDGKTAYAVLLIDGSDVPELEKTTEQKFPSLETIREIYQCVANFLQIPAGEGEGTSYEFDLTSFVRLFKLNSHTALYSLKAVEQDGWIAMNDQSFIPSTVMFTTGREELQGFENENPQFEPCIKALLRTYQGIYDQPAQVSEKVLAGILKQPVNDVKSKLQSLNRFGIIQYLPQIDSPQLLLLRPRVRASDLTIDMRAYQNRKEQYDQRMKTMVRYAKETIACRSRIIGSYFGDNNLPDCRVCDNCRKVHTNSLTREQFANLHHRIINMVRYEELHTKDLLEKLNDVGRERALKVLEFLQSENQIQMDGKGIIRRI